MLDFNHRLFKKSKEEKAKRAHFEEQNKHQQEKMNRYNHVIPVTARDHSKGLSSPLVYRRGR